MRKLITFYGCLIFSLILLLGSVDASAQMPFTSSHQLASNKLINDKVNTPKFQLKGNKKKPTSSVITDRPNGELKTYNRTGQYDYVNSGHLYCGQQDGNKMDVVYGEDGKIYLKNILCGAANYFGADSWVEGTIEGNEIHVPMGQSIYWSDSYQTDVVLAMGESAINEEGYFIFVKDNRTEEAIYLIDGQTITLQGTEGSTELDAQDTNSYLAYGLSTYWEDDNSWTGFLEWNTELHESPALITQTQMPEITNYDNGEAVVVIATGEGHIRMYWDNQLVAEGEGVAIWTIPYSEDPDGEEYSISATAQAEGEEVSEYALATVFVPGIQPEPYQTPAPVVTTELIDDAMVITATGEGTVTLYIQYYDYWTGNYNEENCIGEESVYVPVPRGGYDYYINCWATAQANDDALIGYSENQEILVPAIGLVPVDPHSWGEWLVIFDKNGEEVFYSFNEDYYWDYYYECDGKVNYSFFGDEVIGVPIDIATFSNYQENGFNVKFYVLKDGKRYGPSEDLHALNFGRSYGYEFESLKSNPLIESDNCFTLKLGDLGGGTGTYLFQCEVVDGVPALKASSYFPVVTGTGVSEGAILVTNKDGETRAFSGSQVDLYCDEFGSGDVPFYFQHSDGLEIWTTGAETDMLEAVIDNPFVQRTYRGSNKFTIPAGFRYKISRVEEGLYFGYDFGAYNTYLYVQQLERLNNPIDNLTFTVDKPTVLKGDYQTYRARVDFKEEYVAQVSDVKLEFVLPYDSEFIENSVMVGSSVSDYSISVSSSRYGIQSIITVPVANFSQPVRLCATPGDSEGYTSAEAFVTYNMNGETIRRSIGKVSFYVSNASIYVTPVTTDSRITVYGIAAGGKAVKVYDGDVLIAETACLTNGSWLVDCNLHQPVTPSVHPIHATISTQDGIAINTETVEVEYRLSAPQPNKITMCFLDSENVFDFVNATTTPGYYTVPTSEIYSTYFTFVANLKGTTATVHNLKFKILDTQGKIITRNGNYVPSRNEWVCQASYPDVNKLPITVGLSYDYVWEGVLCHYENDFTDNTNGVTPNVTPHVMLTDPSGFVYEGVPSNRLEGVTATCYYKDPETGEAVLWNAEQYEQHNPLLTDENGYYRWDVPAGQWQVKYEKEGYETTYSNWLPVPPPQLDVNIGMVDKTPPTVIKAHAYPQAVEMEFGKYMFPETLTTDNISVLVNGTAMSGTIELLNAEVDDPLAITTIRRAPGTGLTFASRVRFNATQPFNANEVTLHVKKNVTSYAGVQMNTDYEALLPLEVEMQAIVADSAAVVPFMGERLLSVAVRPAAAAAGKVLSVRSMTPMIATTDVENYTLDSNGVAVITVRGDLPGTSLLVYSIEGYDLTASTIIEVMMEPEATVATPTASIASGSEVEKGTMLYLFCSTTEGATIYYTLDGSCPCDPSPARMTYDGNPIIINSTVTIKAMATAPDLYDSEVATFVYRISGGVKGDVNGDGEVNIADVNAAIGIILDHAVDQATWNRADVNDDGEVNIVDLNEIIKIILNSTVNLNVNCNDLLHAGDVAMSPGDVLTLPVMLDHASRYSAMQCDITMPEGLTLLGVNAANGGVTRMDKNNDMTTRALTYSMDACPLAQGGQTVITLTVRADAALSSDSQITLHNVVIADAASRAWRVADCKVNVANASGISDLSAGDNRVWVESRTLCLRSSRDGMARLVTVSGVTQEFNYSAGVTRHEVEPGIYVVLLDGVSHKVIVK